MLWPILTLLALAAALAVHFAWRARAARLEASLQREIQRLNEEQRQAADRLQTRQGALFDSMAEGLLILDGNGKIQLANRAFLSLFGITADIRSRTVLEALRLHEISELVEFIAGEKQVVGKELRLSRPVERWLEVNGAPIPGANGGRDGTILVFHDLTRLKQLENTRKDFVANVSHELRTPLSLIKGYCETLLGGAKDDPAMAARFLRTIERNADRLHFLIEDLLVISELESGRVQLNLQPVALSPLIDKVLEDLRLRADERGMVLSRETDGLCVHADAGRIEQVLANLVENAVKYGNERGRVTVSARALPEGMAEVSVRDDGPGIPAEALERLFERFYRVDKARSREQGGTGLGLSIVKHIVQSHGGKAWAKSKPGQGATFYFTLPLPPPESP